MPSLWAPHPLPRHTAETFPLMCQLMIITQDVAAVYGSCEANLIPDRVPLAFLESKYQKMLACMDTLPIIQDDFARGADATLHVLVL